MIYHIASHSDWTRAQATGLYNPPSLESEGFIHCSRLDQVLTVANNFYQGQSDLLLLCIEEGELASELRWEAPAHPKGNIFSATKSAELFPHLYGPLNLKAVTAALAFEERGKGFALPRALP